MILGIGIQDANFILSHAEVLKMYTEVFGISYTPNTKYEMLKAMHEYFLKGGS